MTIRDVYPCYVANRPEQPNRDLEVTDKYSGEVATRVALADAKTIDRAIQKAVEATGPMARLPAYARAKVLHHCVKRFEERAEELALLLCVEAGKPIKDSRGGVMRLIDTFRIAAEEATRMTGRCFPWTLLRAPKDMWGCGSGCPSGPARSYPPSTFRSISPPIK